MSIPKPCSASIRPIEPLRRHWFEPNGEAGDPCGNEQARREAAPVRQPGQAVAPALLLEQVALLAQFVLQVEALQDVEVGRQEFLGLPDFRQLVQEKFQLVQLF